MQTKKKWLVAKFGGTSVATKKNWLKIEKILSSYKEENLYPFLVCSAITKVSSKLENLCRKASLSAYKIELTELRKIHQDFCLDLELGKQASAFIAEEFEKLEKLCLGISLFARCSPDIQARVLAFGELLLTRLASLWFEQKGYKTYFLDARKVLQASPASKNSSEYLISFCRPQADKSLQEKLAASGCELVITQGFIAANKQAETVLLGRGGSDTSAAYFAVLLEAKRLDIWTDVPGIFTSNPRDIPEARLLKELSYEEAQELATSGAQVIHPHCLLPLKNYQIPCQICWIESPKQEGTLIHDKKRQCEASLLKAILARKNIYLISMESLSMWQEVGFLEKIFSCFKSSGISIDLIATSQSNVTVSLDQMSSVLEGKKLEALFTELKEFCQPKLKGPYGAISLVGQNIRSILHKIGTKFAAFEEKNIHLISQSASNLNFTFIVDEDEAHKTVRHLHEKFFAEVRLATGFGPSWADLAQENKKEDGLKHEAWWQVKRDKLLQLKEKTPLYVYDLSRVKKAILEIKSLATDRVHYAVKANDHPEIIKLIASEGLGFDCVSIEEILYVKSQFEKNKKLDIGFTPNFVSYKEYIKALDEGAEITVDNVNLLICHPEIFSKQAIHLRLDPNIRAGHHKFVKTSGSQSKFGISYQDLEKVQKICQQENISIKGLHAHIGSGIKDESLWTKAAQILITIAGEYFPNCKVLNLGGGFGVREQRNEVSLDIVKLKKNFLQIKKAYPQFELWIEPGRYLVAEAGILLTTVTQRKQKGSKNYLGVDVGMNSFLRPSLYGSYHEISNITCDKESEEKELVDVVGPICESGDVLGYNRLMGKAKIGDLLLIATAGAYGRVMASNYNRKAPAAEMVIDL